MTLALVSPRQWTLGYILYGLAYQKKAFSEEVGTWEYGLSPDKFKDIPPLQVDECTASCDETSY
jgi:hypothetical protein